MISFIDAEGKRHNALTEVRRKKAVNGEKSLEGTVFTNDNVLHGIDRGWRLDFEDERYVVTYARPIDNGDLVEMEFDAVHEFFYDMSKSVVYDTLNGSKTMRAYLNFIFDGIDYDYVLDVDVPAFEKENFGMKNRLELFKDIIKSTGLEFIVNGRVVRIMREVGRDLTTTVRKGLNMQDLTIEKNINDFITYKRGFGAWYDDDDHSKGRLEVEYESPLASIYGRLEGDPVVDERYSIEENLLSRITEEVENSYSISVQLTMEDLVKAGYEYERPQEGDYIMGINEDLQFFKRLRVVSYESEFDTTGELVDHFVTCNSIGLVQETENRQFAPIYAEIDRLDQQDQVIQVAANGKNRVFRGETEPTEGMVKNDVWYKPVGNGELEMYVYTGAYWNLEKVSAGLLGGTLDADVENGDVNLINVNVANLVGNYGNFIRLLLESASSFTTINGEGIRVNHNDGTYTQLTSEGVKRHTSSDNRNYHYLIYATTFVYGSSSNTARWIQLPDDFKGKDFQVYLGIADSLNAINYHRSIQRIVATGHPNYRIDHKNARVPIIAYKSETLGDGVKPEITDVQGMLLAIY